MIKIVTAPCSLCFEGRVPNPNSADNQVCSVCGGTSIVTPFNICTCGLSCRQIEDDVPYCGDSKCLAILKARRFLPAYDQNLEESRFHRNF